MLGSPKNDFQNEKSFHLKRFLKYVSKEIIREKWDSRGTIEKVSQSKIMYNNIKMSVLKRF